MTAIKVNTLPAELDEVERPLRPQASMSSNASSIQMEGMVADNSTSRPNRSRTEIGGIPTPYSSDHPPGGRINASDLEGRERAASRLSMPASWKSEPDLDTIMPLPGGQESPPGFGVYGGAEEDEEEGDSPSFTNVEVREKFAILLHCCPAQLLNHARCVVKNW